MSARRPIKIALLKVPNYLKFSFHGVLEYFEYANQLLGYDCFAMDEIAVGEEQTLQTDYDCLIVPPVKDGLHPAKLPPNVMDWILALNHQGSTICSACAGSFFLAQTGILDNLEATTHWKLEAAFREKYPRVRLNCEKLIVHQGSIITAGGLSAWTDLCVFLTAKFASPSLVREMSRLFLVDSGPREQKYYTMFLPATQHGDDAVLKCQRWIEHHLSQSVEKLELERISKLGTRTLQRRFRNATGYSITEYLQQTRVQYARNLLTDSDLQVEQIVWDIGYEDVPTFGKLFKRIVGLSPAAYRKRFRLANGG